MCAKEFLFLHAPSPRQGHRRLQQAPTTLSVCTHSLSQLSSQRFWGKNALFSPCHSKEWAVLLFGAYPSLVMSFFTPSPHCKATYTKFILADKSIFCNLQHVYQENIHMLCTSFLDTSTDDSACLSQKMFQKHLRLKVTAPADSCALACNLYHLWYKLDKSPGIWEIPRCTSTFRWVDIGFLRKKCCLTHQIKSGP